MIFSGDFVFPENFSEKLFEGLGEAFLKKTKILNYESTLKEFNKIKKTQGIALYSSADTIKALKVLNVICTSHANNHVTDFNYDINQYKCFFTVNGITPIGVGQTIKEASQPFLNHIEKMLILPFGWETIRCKAPKKYRTGVSPYRYKFVEQQVELSKKKYPNYKIIIFVHWNYEFEIYPLPADRQFSHHLIDLGVDAIFGHHPHIMNGYEVYKNKPIFYSLGNFYFPQVKYGDHQLSFRDSALEGISVDYNGNIDELIIYHHTQDKKNSALRLEGCYKLGEFEKLNQLSKFQILDHGSYINFYKKNHFHKNKLLPIYKNYKNNLVIECFNLFVKLRQVPIDILTKLKNKP